MTRRSIVLFAVLPAVLLSGCAGRTRGLALTTVGTRQIPVATPCAVDPGSRPAFPDRTAAIAAAPNIFERAKLYAAGRQARIDWEARLEAAVAGCRQPGRSAPDGP